MDLLKDARQQPSLWGLRYVHVKKSLVLTQIFYEPAGYKIPLV